MYQLEFLPSAKKELKKLDSLHQKQIKSKILLLKEDPDFLKNNIKPLQGDYKGLFRLRVGSYRVVFQVKEEEIIILIIRIGHRKEIY